MMHSLVDRVREQFRRAGALSSAEWRAIYEQALAEAYGAQRPDQVAELAMLAAVRLDAEGRFPEAVAQLDFGLGMAGDVPDTVMHLLCVKAAYEAISGDPGGARQSLQGAAALLCPASSARADVEYKIYSATVACLLLEDADLDLFVEPIRLAERSGYEWLASGLKSWFVPWLVARGDQLRARPWAQSLRVQAEQSGSQWRLDDARAFDSALQSINDCPSGGHARLASRNYLTRWRELLLAIRRAVVGAHWEEARELVGHLRSVEAGANRDATNAESFSALIDGYRQESVADCPHPPPALTLMSLPSALAGAEAVAIAGTQAEAVRWEQWLRSALPRHVRSTMEWPVSADRVRGLLQIRNGDRRGGVTSLRRSIRWSDAAGYNLEAALARVQLSEILALAGTARSEREAILLRRAGREALSARAIDPLPHSYAAVRSVALERAAGHGRNLTPREVEVLTHLSEGLSYRETADLLGVGWRTVQTHAYRLYDKLGVSGKVAAMSKAREEGII